MRSDVHSALVLPKPVTAMMACVRRLGSVWVRSFFHSSSVLPPTYSILDFFEPGLSCDGDSAGPRAALPLSFLSLPERCARAGSVVVTARNSRARAAAATWRMIDPLGRASPITPEYQRRGAGGNDETGFRRPHPPAPSPARRGGARFP